MTAPYRKVNYGKIIQKYALTVSLAFLAPIVLILLGIIIISVGDRRVDSIQSYNERVLLWQSFKDAFRNASFYLDDFEMDLREMPQMYYFPTADACNQVGDPSEGCVYSDSIYYSYNYTVSGEVFNFTISDIYNHPIVSDRVSVKDTSRVNQHSLNCWDRESCTQACTNLLGIWDVYTNECVITRYLSKICYRVLFVNGTFTIDKSSFIDANHMGCYYSNLWSPYRYSDSKSEYTIPINIRYYLDPVISASDTTHGCSDDKMYVEGDSNCFGSTKWEQARAGKHMLGIGFILFICEMIVSCGIVVLLVAYVYQNRRVNPKVQLSESMEVMFTPYSVDELVSMHSPHVEEIREWTASRKRLLSPYDCLLKK